MTNLISRVNRGNTFEHYGFAYSFYVKHGRAFESEKLVETKNASRTLNGEPDRPVYARLRKHRPPFWEEKTERTENKLNGVRKRRYYVARPASAAPMGCIIISTNRTFFRVNRN